MAWNTPYSRYGDLGVLTAVFCTGCGCQSLLHKINRHLLSTETTETFDRILLSPVFVAHLDRPLDNLIPASTEF